ncbi:unnamed protein product, partial [Brachionus calyciflorus]
ILTEIRDPQHINNIHVMHLTLNWPSKVTTIPHLNTIAIDSELLFEFNRLLKASRSEICIEYDTTFILTGYYVSVLSFIHSFQKFSSKNSSPPIPLVFLVHEKKYEEMHDDFWRYMKKVSPDHFLSSIEAWFVYKKKTKKIRNRRQNGYVDENGFETEKWSQDFIDYFDKNISIDIENIAAYAVKEKCAP